MRGDSQFILHKITIKIYNVMQWAPFTRQFGQWPFLIISLWKSLLPSEGLLKRKKLIPPKAYLNELQQQGLA